VGRASATTPAPGRIPLDEVEFDADARIIRLDTMGIERFIAG